MSGAPPGRDRAPRERRPSGQRRDDPAPRRSGCRRPARPRSPWPGHARRRRRHAPAVRRRLVPGGRWSCRSSPPTRSAVLRRLGVGLVTARACRDRRRRRRSSPGPGSPTPPIGCCRPAETLTQAGDDLRAAWHLFGDVRAPAPVENGFLATTAGGDLGAWCTWPTGRPSACRSPSRRCCRPPRLFVFAAALGRPRQPGGQRRRVLGRRRSCTRCCTAPRTRSGARAGRVATGARAAGRSWAPAGDHRGHRRRGRVDRRAQPAGRRRRRPGGVARHQRGPARPRRLSPIVELQTKLIDQPRSRCSTSAASAPSYWRLTALDEFDGSIWKSSYRPTTPTASCRGARPGRLERDGHQEIEIDALSLGVAARGVRAGVASTRAPSRPRSTTSSRAP